MFGFSSSSCYTCFYLDSDSVNSDRGWCNNKRKWIYLDGAACKEYEERFYLATLCVDDVNMLRTLYNFRDIYMCQNDLGKEFLSEYHVIGDTLVQNIKKDMYKTDIIKELKDTYLLPMIDFINNNRLDDAQDTFINMVDSIKVRYGYEPMNKEKTLIKF